MNEMPITETELETLKNSNNEQEWTATCDAIKRARGNRYPPDWFEKVVMSGLATTVSGSW